MDMAEQLAEKRVEKFPISTQWDTNMGKDLKLLDLTSQFPDNLKIP